MKRFCFGILVVLLFSAYASSQANQSQSKVRDAAVSYRYATLLKLTGQARTQSQDLRHTSLLDSLIVTETIVTYEFTIRSGPLLYVSHYTPEKPTEILPHAWWHGFTPVAIRVRKHTLYIRFPEGGEVASHIVSQTSTAN